MVADGGLFRIDHRHFVSRALASIYAWGVDDALVALIGKKFGKHKIKWKLADGKKSVEGSLACSSLLSFPYSLF